MSAPSPVQARRWMDQWRSAGVALASLRAAEVAQVDLWQVAEALEEALLAAVADRELPRTSGLVEQQRIFARVRPG